MRLVRGKLHPAIIERIPMVADSLSSVEEQLRAVSDVAVRLGLLKAASVIRREAKRRRGKNK